MNRLLLLLAACGNDAATDPCDGVTSACITVQLDGDVALDTIEIDVAYGDEHDTIALPATSLPAITSVRLSPAAPIDVSIVAAALRDHAVTGTGFAAPPAAIVDGAHAKIEIVLDTTITCTAGTNHCGGDGLPGDPSRVYRCSTTNVSASRGICPYNGTCVNGACTQQMGACSSGFYCGGDKTIGDPQALYHCTAPGAYTLDRECGKRCKLFTADDDQCID